MPDVNITNLPAFKDKPSALAPAAPDNTMSQALDKVKSNAASMAKNTAGKMMGGNTVISVNSMKGEALRGRNDNLSCKKMFKTNRFCRGAE